MKALDWSLLRRLLGPPPAPRRDYPVHLPAATPARRGRVLMSYLAGGVHLPDGHPGLMTHSNLWESREIARIFSRMGYDVDVIAWDDHRFVPKADYDVVFDIDANLQRLAPLLPERAVRILHLTGSYGPFQNAEELARVAAFEARTGKLYSPKRLLRWVELSERSLRLAHQCSLLGNAATLSTYPEAYRDKISLVPVSGSFLDQVRDGAAIRAAAGGEFLWFYGAGAVHKGLDLVLEAFANHPEWTLHVVGEAPEEPDFKRACSELLARPQVHLHGRLVPGSAAFREKLDRVFCFIAPSCSEGISPAAVTCLQFGLYPILGRRNGIDLPAGCGIALDDVSPASIERAAMAAQALSPEEVVLQTCRCQEMAMQTFSREAFSRAYHQFLETMLG